MKHDIPGAALVFAAALMVASAAQANSANGIAAVGLPDEPVTLDPAAGQSGYEMPYLYAIYDRLVDMDPATLDLRPGLATEWHWMEDGRSLQLTLRRGVTFQDGTRLDAEAVKASLLHMQETKVNHDLDPVDQIEVVDPYTLILHVNQDYSVLPAALADRAGMVVSPSALAKEGSDFNRKPVGAGPFMVTGWESGTALHMAKYQGYWNQAATRLQGIDFRFIPNPTSMVAAVQSGQLDYATGLDAIDLPMLEKNPKLALETGPTVGFPSVWINTSIAPVNDARVRRAMNYAIDRQALARAVYGRAVKAMPAQLPVPPGYWTSDAANAAPFPYDLAKAKALLAAAGHPDGVTVPICVPSVGNGLPDRQVMDILSEQMKPAGIRFDINEVATFAACGQQFFVQHAIAAVLVTWSGRPDPYLTYLQLFGSKGPYNAGSTSYPGVDGLLAQLLATPDRTAQKPLYAQLNRAWVKNAPGVPLYYNVDSIAYNKGLGGVTPSLLARAYVRNLYFK